MSIQCPECKSRNISLIIDDELLAQVVCDDCGLEGNKFRVYPENDISKAKHDPEGLLEGEKT